MKNWSIRKAFQYKSTVKPVIICLLNSDKCLNIPFEVHRSKALLGEAGTERERARNRGRHGDQWVKCYFQNFSLHCL